jgi:hypothetical protein
VVDSSGETRWWRCWWATPARATVSCSAAAVANPWQRAAVIPNQVLSGRKLRRRVWLAAAVALTVGVRQLPATDVRARGPLVGSGSDIESCKMCPGLNLKCETKSFVILGQPAGCGGARARANPARYRWQQRAKPSGGLHSVRPHCVGMELAKLASVIASRIAM